MPLLPNHRDGKKKYIRNLPCPIDSGKGYIKIQKELSL